MKLLTQTKALADDTRLRLLGVLSRHELNVGEIVQVMGMGQSRISRHLKILMDAGFVVCKRNGLWAFYATAAGNGAQALLGAVLEGLRDVPEHERDLKSADAVLQERRQSTVRFFDELAADWIRMSHEILGEFDLSAVILDHLARSGITAQRGVVADLGCGPGLMLGLMAGQASQVIGVDNSSRMLDAAAKHLPEGQDVSLRIGDLEHLPLRDGEADAAVMSLVLHHLASPQAGLAETGRVLRPGGQLILADFLSHDNETMRLRYGDRWLGFAATDLDTWLRRAGFQDVAACVYEVNMGLQLQVVTARQEEFSV